MFTDDNISKELILTGLHNGTIKIINNTNDGCIAAQIGDYWFYFADTKNADLTAEKYCKIYTKEEIANQIYDSINDEPIKGETEDESTEWLYYKACLLENNKKGE